MGSTITQRVCSRYAKRGGCKFGDNCQYRHVVVKESRAETTLVREGPIDAYFAQYPEFAYNPSVGVTQAFRKMSKFYGWEKDERQEAKGDLMRAIVLEFNHVYGSDVQSFASWQSLCSALTIEPMPDNIKECKKALKHLHMNLVDLIDTKKTGRTVKKFDCELQLSIYTNKTRKYFPKDDALLRFLLRRIKSPSRR